MNKHLRSEFEKGFPKGVTRKKISKALYKKVLEDVYNYAVLCTLDEIAFKLKDKTLTSLDEFKGELHLMAREKLKDAGTAMGREFSDLDWLMNYFENITEANL